MVFETATRRVLLAGAAALFTVGLATPLLRSPWPYFLLHSVCHQEPSRCLFLAGALTALCARCLGIYAGAALALALGARPSRRFLIAAAGLLFIDVFTEWLGLRPAWVIGRIITGLLAGFAASPIAARAAAVALHGRVVPAGGASS